MFLLRKKFVIKTVDFITEMLYYTYEFDIKRGGVMMLTQRLGSGKDDKYMDTVLKIIKENPGSCDEVWFATEYGFPPLERHTAAAEGIISTAEKFRKEGIRVSLQLSNTIGHGEYIASCDCSGLLFEGSEVEHMVGDDGKLAEYCFCWRGKNFKKYTYDAIKKYAGVKPHAIWIDDDLRPCNHMPVNHGCFCDDCLKKFNDIYGSSFTRSELVHEINFGDTKWRKRYMDFVKDGLYEFTFELCSAIHEVMPETSVGLQQGGFGGYIEGGAHSILKAICDATGKPPLSRPGGGAYDDYNPMEFIDKGRTMLKQIRDLPPYVKEIRPEIENLPFVTYGKSIPGVCFETSYYFAIGATAMSYSMMMHLKESIDWYGQMLNAFSHHRSYWQELAETNKTTSPDGITLVCPHSNMSIKCTKPFDYVLGDNEYEEDILGFISLPLVYEYRDSGVFVMCGKTAEKLSDEEIEKLIGLPVLTDGDAIDVLKKRCFDLGISAEKISVLMLNEEFSEHKINCGHLGDTWNGKFLISEAYKLVGGNPEVMGRYKKTVPGYEENDGTIANAIITTPKGAKWAVFGFDLFNRTVSTAKREQIFNSIEYISDKNISARMITAFSSTIHPRVNADGSLACVSITNCTMGKQENIKIKVQCEPGTKAVLMGQYLTPSELTVDENNIVTIPEIGGWNVATLFFE